MSSTHFVAFTAFIIFSIVTSFGVVRSANFLYGKIGTCHPASYHVAGEEEFERFAIKVGKLGLYNFIVVLSTAGLIVLYVLSPVGSGIGLDVSAWFALITVSLVMNFSLRVGALADIKTQYYDEILGRSLSFGFGFVLSIYFLMLFGVGSHVLKNGFSLTYSGTIEIPNNLTALFLLLIIVGPWIVALFSELVLHPRVLGVAEDYMDKMESS